MSRPDLDAIEKVCTDCCPESIGELIAYARELETMCASLAKACEEDTTTIEVLGELVSKERNKKIEALKRIRFLESKL